MTAETRLRTGRRARARRFACAALCLLVLWTATVACAAGGSDFIGTEWYQAALLRSEMALGNNTRLLDVIRRAQSGEQVTRRALEALKPIIEAGEDAVVITHGGVIGGVLAKLFPNPNGRFAFTPGTGTGYAVRFEGAEPIEYHRIPEYENE